MANYIDHINLLPESIKKETVYDFNQDALSHYYQAFFDFCLTNIRTQWPHFDIAHCGFVFRDSLVNNACARRDAQRIPWIEINGGLFQNLFYKFHYYREYINALPETPIIKNLKGEDAYYLMFQGATIFLYYHELAHIIQYSGPNVIVTEQSASERYAAGNVHQYNILEHALEMDADEFGANMLYEQIAYHFNQVNEETKSTEILAALMTTGLASIFLLFEMLGGGITLPMHFDSGSHPSSVIRIVSITGLILDKLTNQFGDQYALKINEVIRRAFQIVQPITEAPDSLNNFFAALVQNRERIVQYSGQLVAERNSYFEMAGVRMRPGN